MTKTNAKTKLVTAQKFTGSSELSPGPIVSMVEAQGRVLLATEQQVFELVRDQWVPIRFMLK